MKKYLIIGKDDCPFCDNAVSLADARKLNYEYLKLNEDITEEEAFRRTGRTIHSVPHIQFENEGVKEFVGGFTEFIKFVNKNK